MGDTVPITARGVEDRVTGYGDRVVAQVDGTTRTPAVPPTPRTDPVAAAAQAIAQITLYDPLSYMGAKVAGQVLTEVHRALNALRGKFAADHLATALGVRFEVQQLMRTGARAERSGMRRLDIPLYILTAHAPGRTTAAAVRDLAAEHGIRSTAKLKEIEEGWDNKAVLGLGIQPLPGFRKVGFVKGDEIVRQARDKVAVAFGNVVKHELGHMCNIPYHAAQGVMQKETALLADARNYSRDDETLMLQSLEYLIRNSEQEMQRAYDQSVR